MKSRSGLLLHFVFSTVIALAFACSPAMGHADVSATTVTASDSKIYPLDPPGYFGINGVGIFHRPHAADELAFRWKLMKELGVRWDRSDFWWGDMEKKPGQWDFQLPDKAVKTYREHHVQIFPILDYGAAWWHGKAPASDADLEAWANYVSTVVGRYAPYADTWEVWNEPNIIPFWMPQPDAEMYGRLLRRTAEAARKANPAVKLVGFTLAGLDTDFLDRTLNVAGPNSFDIFSYHFYRSTQPELDTPDEVNLAKIILQQHGAGGKPIWVTEMGLSSHLSKQGVSERLQATYLTRQLLLLVASGVQRIFPFCLVDNVSDPAGPWGAQLGLVTLDGRRKPAFFAFKTLIYELHDWEYAGTVFLGKQTHALVFQPRYSGDPFAGESLMAVWTTSDERDLRVSIDDIAVTSTEPGRLTALSPIEDPCKVVYNMDGTTTPMELDGATQRFMISSEPKYVIIKNRALLTEAKTAFENNPVCVPPGESIIIPKLHGPEAIDNVSYDCPPGLKIENGRIIAPPKAEEKWYGVIAHYTTKFGPAQKELRVLVRAGFHVRLQAIPDPDTKTLLTTFTVRNSEALRRVDYLVSSSPVLLDVALPAGRLSQFETTRGQAAHGAPVPAAAFRQTTVSIPLATFARLKKPLQFSANVKSGESSHRIGLFRVGITPLLLTAPKIDGDIREATGLASFTLDSGSQVVPGEFPAAYKGNKDASAKIWAAWSMNGLYIAADIADDFPMMNLQEPGPDIFRGDGVEVYFRPGGSGGHHYSSKENGFYHFAISTGQAGRNAAVSDFETTVPGASVAVRSREGGCTLEAIIPYASLGNYKPAPGDMNAWDLELNDCDSYSHRAGQKSLVWNGNGENWLYSDKWGLSVVPVND